MINSRKKIVLQILILFLYLGVGFLLGRLSPPSVEVMSSDYSLRDFDSRYSHINPLLECNAIENISNRQVREMKGRVEHIIDTEKTYGNVSHVSVYFRDLNNGPWFGINEKEKFIPSSLLKTPFMIALFKLAENDPTFLGTRVLYHKDTVNNLLEQYYKPKVPLVDGKEYTTLELIRQMIVYSDNDATLALLMNIDESRINSVYADLDIEKPLDKGYEISTRSYASFFRILFNATYLEREFSEKALTILGETDFKDGLESGLPGSVKISHKFGEHTSETGSFKQLHDCGIVYYPKRPYLLCVMTRSERDFSSQAKVIGEISKVVYDDIDKNDASGN